jgi:hypothetical protein
MIPGKIVSFLEERGNVACCGTRDVQLVPHLHRVSGWRVGADRASLECLVPELFGEHLIDSLEDNGRIAVTVEEFPSHETYQFKGRYVSHRSPAAEDRKTWEVCRERFVRAVRRMLPVPEELLRLWVLEPRFVVSFKVEEIYLQTPGPGAGTRLVPRAE